MPGLSRSSSNADIEYSGPMKRVRLKSAAEGKPKKSSLKHSTYTINDTAGTRSAPPTRDYPEEEEAPARPAVSMRHAWGYQNPRNKKKVLQSERDPFYSEQKARKEAIKARRQRTLEAIANQSAPTVARKSTVAARARNKSRDGQGEDLFAQPSSVHVKSKNKVTGEEKRPLHARSRSPAAPPLQNYLTEQELRRETQQQQHRGRSKSPATRRSGRSTSPPVPALKHRDYNSDNYDSYRRGDVAALSRLDSHRKYGDSDPTNAPVTDGQFVPFIRSANVLDPAYAEEPLPLSREPSTMLRARQAYIQEHEPAKYGTLMENYEDNRIYDQVPKQTAQPPHHKVSQLA